MVPRGGRAGFRCPGSAALEDDALLEKIDGWVIGAVLKVVEQHRGEVVSSSPRP